MMPTITSSGSARCGGNLDTAKHPLEVQVNGETVGWYSNAKLAEDQARYWRSHRGAFAVDVIDHHNRASQC